jgi:hypothetical protein
MRDAPWQGWDQPIAAEIQDLVVSFPAENIAWMSGTATQDRCKGTVGASGARPHPTATDHLNQSPR